MSTLMPIYIFLSVLCMCTHVQHSDCDCTIVSWSARALTTGCTVAQPIRDRDQGTSPEPLPETGVSANHHSKKSVDRQTLVLKFVGRPRYRVQDGSWPNHKNHYFFYFLVIFSVEVHFTLRVVSIF